MISIKNISFSYGKRKIFDEVSVEIRGGDFLALLGANGAGKSTLLKIASGILKPTSGEIFVDKTPLKEMSARKLATLRAVLEQESALNFDYTVLDTVLLGRYAYNVFPQNSDSDISIARDCLERVGLGDFSDRFYTRLSGGEKQRVQLARALCQIGDNPAGKTLLLDEPSAGLDPAHAHAAMNAAQWVVKGGGAVVAVLHDANLAAAYATKIALLKGGKIIALDAPEKVLTPELLGKTYDAPCEIAQSQSGASIVYFPPKL